MSITDHFAPVQDAGFKQAIDPDTARRQFNVSAGLAAILGLTALALTFVVPMPSLETGLGRERLQATVQMPHKVQVRHAAQDVKALPGG